MKLILGDCLEKMKDIEDGSVDMILADPPYGAINGANLKGWDDSTTAWDIIIDHEEMLNQCNRVLKMNGALVIFSQDPYTGKLMTDTHGNLPFSYRLTWLKNHFANPLMSKKAPVSYTEDICLFFKKYDMQAQHPLREYCEKLFSFIGKKKKEIFSDMGHQGVCHFMRYKTMQFELCTEKTYNQLIQLYKIDSIDCFMLYEDMKTKDNEFKAETARTFNLDGMKYKSNILSYKKDYTRHHPTQKPVALMEDLIKTYTNEGETVLDFTMGSGTTGIACKNLNRDFIGIELDEKYYQIACERINGIP